MRFAAAISLCFALAACSGTRAREVHGAQTTASASLPKTADPSRCQSLYTRAVADCRAAKDDTPYDDCVNAAVVELNSCLDAL
jgi:hypothetical protein